MRTQLNALAGAACIGLVLSSASPAFAADVESGYRYKSSCGADEPRPAVAWRALGSRVEVTPPGAGYTLIYNTNGIYTGTENGGLTAGGKWIVYVTTGDVDQGNTFGSCTS